MKHAITQSFWHKGFVFLFTRIETYGIWSTHKTEDDKNKGIAYYRAKFQAEHDKQIDDLYAQAVKEEGMLLAKEGQTVDDRTEESRQILKETSKN